MQVLKKIFLLFCVVVMSACTDQQAKEMMKSWQDNPKLSYYPYLKVDQYRFLNQQNIIGLLPGEIILPEHSAQVITADLNANSWWGLWPYEISFSNYFLAEQAKRTLGCGPLKAGTQFTVKPGVYTLMRRKISISHSLSWTLKQDIPSMCETKTKLPLEYFDHESQYWDMPFKENRIYP